MPRRSRNWLEGACYHITHRCQGRAFLLRFATDRNQYVRRLREMRGIYYISVLDYMITSNHIHLLVSAKTPETISEAMRFLEGSFAQDYNRRKGRQGAVWQGRYKPTLIENGIHLARCLLYIELNMVRAGVVRHPSEWRWSAHDELTGCRQRYRVTDQDVLMDRIGVGGSRGRFIRWYTESLSEKLAQEEWGREAYWSEALAVGAEGFVQRVTKDGTSMPVEKSWNQDRDDNFLGSKAPRSVYQLGTKIQRRKLQTGRIIS